MRARGVILMVLAAALVALVALVVFLARGRGARREAANLAGDPTTIPALEADPEEGLELRVELTEQAGLRRLRLQINGGEAVLILRGPGKPSESGFAFGKAVLEPVADRERGAKFVEAVARWLKIDLPRPTDAQGALVAFPCNYVNLGADDEWEANKLFLEAGHKQAEVFVNVAHDGRRVRLVEKDEEYREDLVALLASILRDGVPPRRTPESDPNLASGEPLANAAAPVPGAEEQRTGAWLASGYLGARRIEDKKTALVRWGHPREVPRQIATVEGWVTDIAPAPRSEQAALSLVHPKSEAAFSSEDPGSLLLLDARDASIVTLTKDEAGSLFGPVWSPDGSKIAFRVADSKAEKASTQVFDVVKKQQLATSDAALDASPLRWDEQGLVLQHYEFGPGGKDSHKYFRWNPGKGAPVELPALDTKVSPDGKFKLTIETDAIEIEGVAKHSLKFSRADDREALEALSDEGELRWVGRNQLVLDLDEPMLLDLASGRLRILFRDRSLRFESASPDGHTVLARDGNDRLVWAQLP